MWNMKSFESMMAEKNMENVGGIILHYTDEDGFRGIVSGKQLRLTKYDKLYGNADEGMHLYEILEDAVRKMNFKGFNKKRKMRLLEKVNEIIRRRDTIFKHWYGHDIGTLECIPYVICFTNNKTGDLPSWL